MTGRWLPTKLAPFLFPIEPAAEAPMPSKPTTVAIMTPGDMGHAVGRALGEHGVQPITCLAGRSARTRGLAEAGGFRDVADLDTLVSEAEMVLAILPPVAAPDLATEVAAAMRRTGAKPVYVDCNAISPGTVAGIAATIADAGAPFIDAGIVGLAPGKAPGKGPRFYVSGADTGPMQALDGCGFEVMPLGAEPGRASALKMTYAGLTKASWTLWTAVLLTAERMGLKDELIAEFDHSQAETLKKMRGKVPFIPADAGRWIGEMEEIAKTFDEAGVTPGFHEGAAWIFRLLDETPFAAETRETLDTSRTLEDSIDAYGAALAARGRKARAG